MEPSEAQYLVINALETLGLLVWRLYDEEKGFWYITSPSRILPRAVIFQNGEVALIEFVQGYDNTE
ncbi:hypothetical protein [Oscillatoria salina]|uniref:hypothetical protein n=1 Tax=Oscillatoria salina TaxID=331517 RepID=UPI0013B8C9F0|nr:hypothetical protein [Oscillatoria salina]MBZ8181361.1 hypothetical protein [Oscillatoria salina IIICB1]NET89742.1 hypothetical protein [Kamptonema sp. SIO1D9]